MNAKSSQVSLLVLMLAVFLAEQSQAELVYTSEFGFIVKNVIHVQQQPKASWLALTDDVDQWWPKSHSYWGESSRFSIDAKAGGCFCETNENNSVEHMRISLVEPNRSLRMLGGLGPLQEMGMHGALDWKFEPNESGTTISLTYRVSGINPDGFDVLAPIVDKVQAQQLGALDTYLTSLIAKSR